MTELLDRKGNPLEEKVSISLPQKDIAETVVEVKEVYNKDFTENFAKITSENYKETNKQENSELFFKWSHGFKDAFVLEEKELLKASRALKINSVERQCLEKCYTLALQRYRLKR
jgi:hypothetical protein